MIITNCFLVHDLVGHRLVTRLFFGDNFGKNDEGHVLKQRQFVEVCLTHQTKVRFLTQNDTDIAYELILKKNFRIYYGL